MRRRRARLATLHCVVACTLILAGCGASKSGSGGGSGGGSGSPVFAVFNAFTGVDATFGPLDTAGCEAAVRLINQDGGVLGHQLQCKNFDSSSDPADAVPNVRQMIATNSDIVGVLGPSTDVASATIPALNQAHLTSFSDSGAAAFDHSTFPYFWRNEPADDDGGYAMALLGHALHYTRAAAVWGTDIGSQGTLPGFLKGWPKVGGTIAINEGLAPGQTSYRSEIEHIIAVHPQVIFTEADPQTTATFLAQLKQLHGLIPIIGSNATAISTWFQPVAKAIGGVALSKAYVGGVNPSATNSGPAYEAYKSSLFATHVPNKAGLATDPTAESRYDAANVMALAMIAAKSTSPQRYNNFIDTVTAARPGAQVVNTFAAGKTALLAGKKIQYIGVTGPELFNQWHSAPSAFTWTRWTPTGGQTTFGSGSSIQQLAQLKASAH